MTLNGIERLRNAFRELVEAEGLRPLAARTGIPVGQIRSLIDGRAVRVTTLERMTTVLGVRLTIGPGPRGDLSATHGDPPASGWWSASPSGAGTAPSVSDGAHLTGQLRDGVGLVRDLADRVAAAAQSLLRLVSGGDPAQGRRIVVHAEGAPCADSPVTIPFAFSVRMSEDGSESVFEPSADVTLAIAPDALPDWAGTNRLVCVRATDDAMEPTIPRGDLVALDPGLTTPLDDEFFVVDTGSGVAIRRLRNRDGWILVADNAQHADRELSGKDHLLGRVAWHGPRDRRPPPEN